METNNAVDTTPSPKTDLFAFGGREFEVLPLDFDTYLEFMTYLTPMLEALAGTFSKMRGLSLPGLAMPELTPSAATSAVLQFCKNVLPEMACIVCNQRAIRDQKPEDVITAEWLKKNANDPFEVVSVVCKQIVKSQMIPKFAGFFVEMLPLIGGVAGAQQTRVTQ